MSETIWEVSRQRLQDPATAFAHLVGRLDGSLMVRPDVTEGPIVLHWWQQLVQQLLEHGAALIVLELTREQILGIPSMLHGSELMRDFLRLRELAESVLPAPSRGETGY